MARGTWLLMFVLAAGVLGAQVRAVAPALPILVTSTDGVTADGGQSVELVREASRRAGLSVSVEIQPWVRALSTAQKNPNVLLFPVTRTPDREAQFEWLGPVNRLEYWIFRSTTGQAPRLTNVAELGNYSIGVLKNDAAAQYLHGRFPESQLQEASEYSSLPPMLLAGRFDYLAAVPPSLYAALADLGKAKTQVQPLFAIPNLSSNPFSYVVAAKGTDPTLVAKLRQGFESMANDGTWETIFRKYQ
jgi:polar amino acid transport system substrate-binding protein